MKQFITLALLAILVTSCDRELRFALDQSGDNRSVIEAVLKHYEDEGDDFKLEAAKFLIRNMPHNYGYEGEGIEKYNALVLETVGVSDNKRVQYFNDKVTTIQGERHAAIDIREVKADYLIRMIDHACNEWRNAPWAKEYDQEVFYEYVLPYRLNNETLSDWHQAIDEEFSYYTQPSLLSRRGVQYEAEKAQGVDCETKEALGTSEGKSVWLNNESSELNFHIPSEGSVTRRLILKYACTDTIHQALFLVNGVVKDTLKLAPTRNSLSYKEKWFNVPFSLQQGDNVVSIAHPSQPIAVDYIQLGAVEPCNSQVETDFSHNYWRIKNLLTNHYITTRKETGASSAPIELTEGVPNDIRQELRIDYQGFQQWKLLCHEKDSAEICLEVKFGTPNTQKPGMPVSQGRPMLKTFQFWYFIPAGEGCFRIMNKQTGMYLESKRDSLSGKDILVQNDYSTSDAQLWTMESAGLNENPNNLFQIHSALSEAVRVFDVTHQFEYYNGNGNIAPRGATLIKAKSGRCRDEAAFTIYLCRHIGIPAAEDFTPNWANRSMNHSWSVIPTSNGGHTPFYMGIMPTDTANTYHPYKKPKVLRRRFSPNMEIVKDIAEEPGRPALFQNPRFTDVTDEYYRTIDVEREVPSDIAEEHSVAYICVFDNKNWVPVYYGKIKGGKVTYRSMVGDIVYMSGVYENGHLELFGSPFLVKKDGTIQSFEPDLEHRGDMYLIRKYPFLGADSFFNLRMDGGQFQGANKSDFSDAVTFHTHRGATNGDWYDIPVADSLGQYKYLRYIGSKGSFCNINELEFYDENNVKVSGKIIGTQGEGWAPKERVFDGDILTGFAALSPDGNWVGLELDAPKHLSRFRYIPRNDGNCVEIGDEYALFCWHNGQFEEIAHEVATRNELNLKDMPTNGLYLLRDLTKGVEERIFTYENGRQVWW